MRLIDADALKETLSNNEAIRIFNLHYDGLIAEIIDNIPTVAEIFKSGSAVAVRPIGGQVVPDNLQGWRYEEEPQGDLITEEQAIDKLHETGWLPRHDKEMTERPQGEWIEKVETKQLGHGWLTTHEIVCSVCGGSGENDENIPQCWKFCPNCGAKMGGGAE